MVLIDIPTEQTTAATDVVLAVMGGLAVWLVRRVKQKAPWKAALWVWIFSLLAAGSLLGAAFHGFQHTQTAREMIWFPMLFLFSIVVALFLVAMLYDAMGKITARRALPVTLVVAVVAFGIMIINSGNFFVLILYEGLAMLISLAGYLWTALRKSAAESWFMAAGVAFTILAAVVQSATKASFTFVWEFDHNGVFHFIQMIGIVFFVLGLRQGSKEVSKSSTASI